MSNYFYQMSNSSSSRVLWGEKCSRFHLMGLPILRDSWYWKRVLSLSCKRYEDFKCYLIFCELKNKLWFLQCFTVILVCIYNLSVCCMAYLIKVILPQHTNLRYKYWIKDCKMIDQLVYIVQLISKNIWTNPALNKCQEVL